MELRYEKSFATLQKCESDAKAVYNEMEECWKSCFVDDIGSK